MPLALAGLAWVLAGVLALPPASLQRDGRAGNAY